MWRQELSGNITTIEELAKEGYIHVSNEEKRELEEIVKKFPMSITRHYLNLINKEDPDDPLRKLYIPGVFEFDMEGSFDTSGEAENTKLNGLQHKYSPTVLMLSTNRCAGYCRFCFRKRMVGLSNNEIAKRLDDVIEYVKEHKEVNNVLVTGGDALMNDDDYVETLLSRLTAIENIQFVRFGSRMLSVMPNRVLNSNILQIFEKYNKIKQIYLITHFNHPNEISEDAIKAVDALKKVGVALKNQTVLLRGINDDATVMATLMNKLNAIGIVPYYIFQCRPVSGVKKQFQVPFEEGYKIIDKTRALLPGPAKQFRYALSHETGKIEVIGAVGEHKMLFKYHQPKHSEDNARIFIADVSDGKAWLTAEDVKK